MDNLLCDPLIRVITRSGGRVALSLPGVLAGLMQAEITGFAVLQPYQAHAWHAFLVQLAAIAQHQAGATPPTDEHTWREWLRNLTTDFPEDEPWRLVVNDLAKPAFLQPPVPEGNLTAFRNQSTSPDGIDLLQTAKNHDVKMARIGHPQADHWLFALVSLQTMAGYMGVGNHGIARMNGGFASRSGVGIRPGPGVASHFRRDLVFLNKYRPEIIEKYPYQPENGDALLWLLPWDGKSSLTLKNLDPYFIEVCRRVRLITGPSNQVVAQLSGSGAARIEAKAFKGVLGDPWTPIRADASLTITGKGFDYDLVSKLLIGDDDYRRSPAQSQDHDPATGDLEFLARAMTRGQGKTEGYHERRVLIPAKARTVFGQPKQLASLAATAKERVEQCGIMAHKILKPAILTMIQEAPDTLNFKDRRADPWLTSLDQRVDEEFFPALWRSLDMVPEQSQRDWLQFLRQAAWKIMTEAQQSLIGGGARRYKTFVAAERTFFGALINQFPLLRNNEGISTGDS